MAHVLIVYRERKRLMLNSDLFSRNLYMYRTKAGMTQKEVAEKSGDVYKRQWPICSMSAAGYPFAAPT